MFWSRSYPRGKKNDRPESAKYTQLKNVKEAPPQIENPSTPSKEVLIGSSQPSKFNILDWLLQNSKLDALWILESLAKERPDVILMFKESAMSEDVSPPRNRRPAPAFTGEPEVKEIAQEASFGDDSRESDSSLLSLPIMPILQFSSPMFYCEEHEGEVLIDVLRLGSADSEVKVAYRTEDESALAGQSYVENSGQLVFAPGERTKCIAVKLIPNPLWNTTTEFRIVLVSVEPPAACLGSYLFETRVRIIDMDEFPSNVFRDREDSVSDIELLLEYCKMTWNTPDIRGGTIRTMLADAFHNFSYFSQLFLNVYLLDFIIDSDHPDSDLFLVHSRRQSLIISAIIHFILVGIAHYLDYLKPSFHMNGKAIAFLQNALLRKFLNYSREVREELESGDVLMAIERDVNLVVVQGYDNCLKVFRNLGQLSCMFLFELIAPHVFGHQVHLTAICALAVLPVILGLFSYARSAIVERYMGEDNRTQNKLASDVALTFQNCSLVFHYNCRNIASRKFDTYVQRHLKARRAALEGDVNNLYFARWVTVVAIALYVWFGGLSVVSGDLALGMFVTNLRVFRAFGTSCEGIFAIVLQVQACLPSMGNIARLLNLPTDVPHRMELNREERRCAAELRETVLKSGQSGEAVDMLPIKLDLHKFQFAASKINFSGVIAIEQGQLVAIVGHMDSGKATLLRLISGALVPQIRAGSEGAVAVFVPAHLRVVNVDHTPLFFNGTLFENLSFGVEVGSADASLDRIRGICNLLGIDRRVLQFLESDDERTWPEIFSGAQCKLLSIARALINNAELICFHKPLVTLDDTKMHVVMKALRDHVKYKGLLETTNPSIRRLRTVVITSSQQFAVAQADELIKVSHDNGFERVEQVLRRDFTRDLLEQISSSAGKS